MTTTTTTTTLYYFVIFSPLSHPYLIFAFKYLITFFDFVCYVALCHDGVVDQTLAKSLVELSKSSDAKEWTLMHVGTLLFQKVYTKRRTFFFRLFTNMVRIYTHTYTFSPYILSNLQL